MNVVFCSGLLCRNRQSQIYAFFVFHCRVSHNLEIACCVKAVTRRLTSQVLFIEILLASCGNESSVRPLSHWMKPFDLSTSTIDASITKLKIMSVFFTLAISRWLYFSTPWERDFLKVGCFTLLESFFIEFALCRASSYIVSCFSNSSMYEFFSLPITSSIYALWPA